jgi:hypothetical protein
LEKGSTNYKPSAHLERTDSRKQKLRSAILEFVSYSKSFPDFETQLKRFGYQVVKGRGISFIDNKAVKTKGNDVGYSLQKIQQLVSGEAAKRFQPDLKEKLTAANLKSVNEKNFQAKDNDLSGLLFKSPKDESSMLLTKSRKSKKRSHRL